MTDTIEVPVSLIKTGDLDAIRELLPKASLFGRWATHPELGRGIVVSSCLTTGEKVDFVYKYGGAASDTAWDIVRLDSLTLDPVDLITLEDFENAPEGTIIESSWGDLYRKSHADHWKGQKINALTETLVTSGPWKILRWGWGK